MEIAARLLADVPVILLDGSTATELRRRGNASGPDRPAVRAVTGEPALVQRIHEEFLRAGTDILTVLTGRPPRSSARTRSLLLRESVRLARSACDRAADGRRVLLAGPLVPPELHTAPSKGRTRRVGSTAFDGEAAALIDAGVDLLFAGPFQDVPTATAAVLAARRSRRPAWALLRPDDGGMLAGGEWPGPAARALVDAGAEAVLVACCPLGQVADPLSEISRSGGDVPFGAAPSGAGTAGRHLAASTVLLAARGWVLGGARILGGCCGTRPAHILALAKAFRPVPEDALDPPPGTSR